MRIGFAQINPTVGDLRGNFEKIAGAYRRLSAAGAELVLTPELAITGYPPQDLVFKSRFVPENLDVLEQLQGVVERAALLVGFVARNAGRGKPFHNAAALLQQGRPMQKTYKALLPTYDVFDEDRYFEPECTMEPLTVGSQRDWRHDLRGYLDRAVSAAALLQCGTGAGIGGAGGRVDSESERLAIHPRESGHPT